jgi:hypothetical protein
MGGAAAPAAGMGMGMQMHNIGMGGMGGGGGGSNMFPNMPNKQTMPNMMQGMQMPGMGLGAMQNTQMQLLGMVRGLWACQWFAMMMGDELTRLLDAAAGHGAWPLGLPVVRSDDGRRAHAAVRCSCWAWCVASGLASGSL